MRCSKCASGRLFRSKRTFLERFLHSRMGLFPWRCNVCSHRILLKVREDQQSRPDPVWTG